MGALTLSQADFKLFKYMMDFWLLLEVIDLEYVKNKATYQKKRLLKPYFDGIFIYNAQS